MFLSSPSLDVRWPNGKQFAFTFFDDTDNAETQNVRAVYDFLLSLGIRTTKSVWVMEPDSPPRIGGVTCADECYRELCQSLSKRGVEISFHNATSTSSVRRTTKEGLDRFFHYFGYYPKCFAHHADNKENLYWGADRLSGFLRCIAKRRMRSHFEGHIKSSPYFWGDLAERHIRYVRNFVFSDLDTGKCDPCTPYHDPNKALVNYWFSSSNGASLDTFLRLATQKNLDQLERDGGFSIIYTHFCSFAKNGKVDDRFQAVMNDLVSRNGWFVPVSELLDHLAAKTPDRTIRKTDLRQLEWRWVIDKSRQRLRSVFPW